MKKTFLFLFTLSCIAFLYAQTDKMEQMHPENSKKKVLNPPKSPEDYNTITFKAV